jgi:hypothetical protein
LRLVIFSLHSELPRCRRNVSYARCDPLAMRRFENGASSSARLMSTECDANLFDPATGGTLMKCS